MSKTNPDDAATPAASLPASPHGTLPDPHPKPGAEAPNSIMPAEAPPVDTDAGGRPKLTETPDAARDVNGAGNLAE